MQEHSYRMIMGVKLRCVVIRRRIIYSSYKKNIKKRKYVIEHHGTCIHILHLRIMIIKIIISVIACAKLIKLFCQKNVPISLTLFCLLITIFNDITASENFAQNT